MLYLDIRLTIMDVAISQTLSSVSAFGYELIIQFLTLQFIHIHLEHLHLFGWQSI